MPPVPTCHGLPWHPHLARSISGPVSGIPTAQTPRTGPNRPAKWCKCIQGTLQNYLLEWASPEALRGGAGIFVYPSMMAPTKTAQLGLWKSQITSHCKMGVPTVASCHGPARQPHLARSISGPVPRIPPAQAPCTGPNRPAKWANYIQSTLHNLSA